MGKGAYALLAAYFTIFGCLISAFMTNKRARKHILLTRIQIMSTSETDDTV